MAERGARARRLPRAGTLIRFAAFAVLVLFLAMPESFAPVFAPLTTNGAPAIYDRAPLIDLTLAHLGTVAVASLAATVVAVGLAVGVTRPAGADFLPLSRSIVNIGQTFPPVAVLALAVPLFGFGERPTLFALFLYGLLPIFENTLTGLTRLPPAVLDAADGMGMTARQRLLKVELPLALPVILEGVKISTVIGLSTATIGSTVAAKGLGEVIIAGLLSGNMAFVVQGGLVVATLAVLLYDSLGALERRVARRTGRRTG
ncbi:ABC transporter permease [Mongoliimonas terrestris]|uniref:ABC transporter permease n=1 Tax=Mongoliimonas terrestris TaxID=1709001 RepID=UPI0009FA6246|nr:ABC transporter permease [Mongoliimonas terrestris]